MVRKRSPVRLRLWAPKAPTYFEKSFNIKKKNDDEKETEVLQVEMQSCTKAVFFSFTICLNSFFKYLNCVSALTLIESGPIYRAYKNKMKGSYK